jgi:DNA helicase-4
VNSQHYVLIQNRVRSAERYDVSQMDLHQTVKELQKNRRELKRQQRLKTLRKILKLLLIGFFIGTDIDRKISELTAKKDLHTQAISEYCTRSLEEISELIEQIQKNSTYLTHRDREQHIATLGSFEADLTHLKKYQVLEEESISEMKEELDRYYEIVSNYNRKFIKQRKKEYSYLFNKKDLSLDEEQKDAIVTDDKYNLVVAAAGSGKTEVLITRIAYLIERKPDGVQPNRILAVAYQRKAKEEIEQRLRTRYKIRDVNVRTFHKLGKDILEKAGNKFRHTDIIDQNKRHEIVKRIFEHKLKAEPDYYKLFVKYMKTLHDSEQEKDSDREKDGLAYLRERAYFAIDHTRVNSRAEKETLDFFLMHKLNGKPITAIYEPDVAQFRPDFVLPKYDIYIEHWGLDKKEEVPKWFSQSTEEYRSNMERKKEWFAKHDKLLVETFAYEYDEDDPDKFTELLKKRVIEKLQTRYEGPFKFTSMTYDEVVKVAWGPYKVPTDEIVNFIKNAKTYGITPTRLAEKLRRGKWSRKQLAFGNLAVKIYDIYEKELRQHGKIDFEDMINNAIEELTNDKNLYACVYDHILIDEYQDISAQRYKLIKKLLERNPKCKLFCVGDDWQSIMGFAGSNLNFFVNFEKYFENPVITKISTNYRSAKAIVDAGADLMRKNGGCQIPKATLSNRKEVNVIRVFRSPHKKKFERRYYEQTVEDCLSRVAEYIHKGYAPRDILVLSRYMRTRMGRMYKFLPIVKILIEKAQEKGINIACDNTHTQREVRLLTVHKSKGLEAKVVFILNAIKDLYGFPCEIEDPSIYAPARENYPLQDQKEEERRLFYVAMTRAKEDLIIYTWEQAKSEFLEEIQEHVTEQRLSY